jgi:hypothetical protein
MAQGVSCNSRKFGPPAHDPLHSFWQAAIGPTVILAWQDKLRFAPTHLRCSPLDDCKGNRAKWPNASSLFGVAKSERTCSAIHLGVPKNRSEKMLNRWSRL